MKALIRYLRDLYSGPFQATLVFSFALVAALTIGAGIWVISVTINSYLSEVMNERVERDIRLAENLYELKLREISGIATQLSIDTLVLENLADASHGDDASIQVIQTEIANNIGGLALGGGQFVAILDTDGDILVGQILTSTGEQQSLETSGNWYDLPIVRQAINQETAITSTEVIPLEFLESVGLGEQAFIELLDTPRAAPEPYDPREGTAGLAMVSAAPVLDQQGTAIGLVLVFHMFNNDFTLVDQIRDAAQIDTVTIFMGDLRVSTNVTTTEGIRAVGTRLSQEVGDIVLLEGREYVGTAFVVDQDYITRYEPLNDHAGQIVGILYVGVRQASFFRLLNTINQRTIIVAFLTILLTFILSTPVSRFITQPLKELRELVKTSHRVADGDLSARASVIPRGEVGQVAASFNTMLDTLQSTQEQLVHSENLASLGQLAAGVAHELNNPLGTILLYSDTMIKERSEDDLSHDDLKMIFNETERCKRIVSALLNFARQNQVIAQPTDINAIIHELIEVAPRGIWTENVYFKTEFDPTFPIIDADPAQLRQVFLNLMTNAMEAMPDGGVLTIRTRNGPPGSVTVEIQDTGAGISEENIGKLFTPFFTTKPIGKGTGLGLSIVYGIIKMHRGKINIQSETGQGTTFTITLPVRLPSTGEGSSPFQQENEGDQSKIG